MAKEKGALQGTPPKCNLRSGQCPAYALHFEASNYRGFARQDKRIEQALEEEKSPLADLAYDVTDQDSQQAEKMESEVEKIRITGKLCSICPYRKAV